MRILASQPSFRLRLAEALLLVASLLSLLAWSWKKWLHPTIDFGKELYLAWRVSEGALLYQDIAHFLGPFSVYWNGLIFRFWGPTLDVLVVSNVLWFMLACWAVHRIFSSLGGRMPALLLVFFFLGTFAFSHLTPIGNYNFITPYTHEAMHGLVLALCALATLVSLFKTAELNRGFWVGFFCGLTALTRPEPAVAALAATFLGLCLHIADPLRRSDAFKLTALYLAGILLPLLLAFVFFASTGMFASDALLASLGAWHVLLTTSVANSPFFLESMGLDNWAGSVGILLQNLGWFFSGLALLGGCAWLLERFSRRSSPRVIYFLAATLFTIVFLSAMQSWRVEIVEYAGRVLPFFSLLGCLYFLRAHIGQRFAIADGKTAILLVWSLFSLLLLGKMILNSRLYHIGFTLAVPATLLLVWLLHAQIPNWIFSAKHTGQKLKVFYFKAGVVALTGALAASTLYESHGYYAIKTAAVGTKQNSFYSYAPRFVDSQPGFLLSGLLEKLQPLLQPQDSLVVLPEGAMLNFLLKRKNPTPYLNFMHTEFTTFGEEAMLRAFQASPPNYVVIFPRDVSEYHVGAFGEDPRNGKQLMDWVKTHFDYQFGLQVRGGLQAQIYKWRTQTLRTEEPNVFGR